MFFGHLCDVFSPIPAGESLGADTLFYSSFPSLQGAGHGLYVGVEVHFQNLSPFWTLKTAQFSSWHFWRPGSWKPGRFSQNQVQPSNSLASRVTRALKCRPRRALRDPPVQWFSNCALRHPGVPEGNLRDHGEGGAEAQGEGLRPPPGQLPPLPDLYYYRRRAEYIAPRYATSAYYFN